MHSYGREAAECFFALWSLKGLKHNKYKMIFDHLYSFSKNNNVFHVVDVLSYHEVIHTPHTTLHFWSSLSGALVILSNN